MLILQIQMLVTVLRIELVVLRSVLPFEPLMQPPVLAPAHSMPVGGIMPCLELVVFGIVFEVESAMQDPMLLVQILVLRLMVRIVSESSACAEQSADTHDRQGNFRLHSNFPFRG